MNEPLTYEQLQFLADLKKSCSVEFRINPECETVPIADYEFMGYEETEDGVIAHFLVLRKTN